MSKFKKGDNVFIKGFVRDSKTEGGCPYIIETSSGFTLAEESSLLPFFEENSTNTNHKTYEDGLNEAWDTAKKIFVEIPYDDLNVIFDTGYLNEIFENNTASEAVEKIKAWEENKKVHVGSVVKLKDTRRIGVVSHIFDSNNASAVVWSNGDVSVTYLADLKNTGHTIDIKGLLNKTRGLAYD